MATSCRRNSDSGAVARTAATALIEKVEPLLTAELNGLLAHDAAHAPGWRG
ncbi:hypothetical protein [Actinomadura sp. NEAU-AAG7]|uniref:hypothetical protein n=1 Tax=Actinomadura sp. NEAU-AAG7 TaxID=2839640 RepID=UPI001BE446DF|nr:hypothetical protein [Actinomadura sp. NEAU-AAG7]MBT2212168.1 hypothetical protein [Actinomadura sp. NEAU-AAG7]